MSHIYNPETHQYFIHGREVPSVTQVLKTAGYLQDYRHQDKARLRGRLVHEATQSLDLQRLDWNTLPQKMRSYLKAYENFKGETGFKPDKIECPVFNESKSYAGTLDRTGTLRDGTKILLDLKTGAVTHSAALQTAAYDYCFPERFVRAAVQLKPNGSYKIYYFTNDNDILVFLSALQNFHRKKML